MATHTTNYVNTFIAVAEDSAAVRGTVPPVNEASPSVAARTWRLIAGRPYAYTSDDVVFTVWADRKDIPERDRAAAREAFFGKGQPCLRASDLGRKYGWGIHHDEQGRVAVVGIETAEYQALHDDPALKTVRAMRSRRA
jgi:hypothetical protein